MKSFLLMIVAVLIVLIVSVPAIILNTIRKLYRLDPISSYFKTIAIGFDQAGGSILYGQEDWTVSSWTYHLHTRNNKSATYFMRFIDLFFGVDHCKLSFEDEAKRLGFK